MQDNCEETIKKGENQLSKPSYKSVLSAELEIVVCSSFAMFNGGVEWNQSDYWGPAEIEVEMEASSK